MYCRRKLEDKVSTIKLVGLPETFAVVLLTFSFVLLLAPYFSGADFGLFKIPQFTDQARKKLKIIGPLLFLASGLLFAPLIPRAAPTTPVSGNELHQTATPNTPRDTHSAVQLHISRARDLYERRKYKDAVMECDAALDRDPANKEARDLKSSIMKTMEILDRNQ